MIELGHIWAKWATQLSEKPSNPARKGRQRGIMDISGEQLLQNMQQFRVIETEQ